MAHHYTTEAVIVGNRPRGEGNAVLMILTRQFGLIFCAGRSVRTHRSKLRGLLQPAFLGTVTLVKGKRSWKVVGAIEEKNIFFSLRGDREAQELLLRLLLLVRRLVRGEEKNELLFDVVVATVRFLERGSFTHEEYKDLERVAALRILSVLGYQTKEVRLKDFVHEPLSFARELLEEMPRVRALATREVNQAIMLAGL